MESVRIGVIGLGWFGEVHCDAIQATPGLELAGLCTRTESRLKDLGRKYGVGVLETDYRALLGRSDLDAVSIVTMWDQHTEPTLAALAAGKHVFLEKPMASTVEDCAAHRGRGGGRAGLPHGGAHLPLQPALRCGQARDRGRQHRPHRGAELAAQHPGGVDA